MVGKKVGHEKNWLEMMDQLEQLSELSGICENMGGVMVNEL